MYIVLALFSAIFAAMVSITAKIALKSIDQAGVPLVTAVRAVLMAVLLVTIVFISGGIKYLKVLRIKDFLFIGLAGLFGALSWLFYFWALKLTPTVKSVYAYDKLSIIFLVIFAALFLKEPLTFKSVVGAILMFLGVLLLS